MSMTACSNKPEASKEATQNVFTEKETAEIEQETEKMTTEELFQSDVKDDELENLIGEYDYLLDNGTGRLIISKTSYGYDISDYVSESSYRFLADSSNIDTIENNRIYIKYPEQVFSDDTVIFSYYILEYGANEINVYYKKDVNGEEQFLYCATKKTSSEIIEQETEKMTTEELLDLFINGSISAISSTDLTSTFYITDLNMDSGEWDSFSIGDKVDLDNDGENELILCGPYGGIYLDARDNKVYEFAAGEGTALTLSYVVYNGATWIMYSNRMYTGYESYHMEKFEGADNLVAEMNFNEKLVDEDNVEGKEKYTLNGTEISYDEYFELCSKIFAAEVYTY
jgi:hypothetical protein